MRLLIFKLFQYVAVGVEFRKTSHASVVNTLTLFVQVLEWEDTIKLNINYINMFSKSVFKLKCSNICMYVVCYADGSSVKTLKLLNDTSK